MLHHSYYQSDITKFLEESPDKILGQLTHNHHFNTLEQTQVQAWQEQIENLKNQLSIERIGQIFFEFFIPRMGKRVDVVLLINDVIFVLEYKTGAKKHDRSAIDQALDYALDLKNFHEGSHARYIVPILISTKAAKRDNVIKWYEDKVAVPLLCNNIDLDSVISLVLEDLKPQMSGPVYGFADEWAKSGYKPTPTIVEAAQALYQGHNVEEISRSDAGAQNLTHTSNCISAIIEHSKQNRRKSICFVTGVPGAGKTLAGLNISTRRVEASSEEQAVFLSGNGPLVAVLCEALARDEVVRSKQAGEPISKKEAARKVNVFIQNIHHFRDHHLAPDKIPHGHVVIFDEAQRAWNQDQAEKFMVKKKGLKSFDMSEPEFLIRIMDRREDWCTIVCLIGGGQEINTGEAGLIEWFNALQKSFLHWDVYHSGQLTNTHYNWGQELGPTLSGLNAVEKKDLHLAVSIRSFRAEQLSAFIGSVIDGDADAALQIHKNLDEYPMAITRDIDKARSWLCKQARGNERLGLVASSGAMRLKPEGVHVKSKMDPTNWFLNGKEDIRSSYYLEDVATEFDIQGLELDWAGVCWDADFRMEGGAWGLYTFKGTKWQTVNDRYRRVYLANAYRVLLTRARQGMIIFVPRGDNDDHTRPADFYDNTYEFLVRCGIKEI
jgi:hypothetical protein